MGSETDDLLKRILGEVLDGREALAKRIDGVATRLDSFRDETLGNLDGTFHRLEKIDSEVQSVSATLVRLERLVEGEKGRSDALRLEIGKLKERLAALEKRLADLETDSTEPH